MLKVLLLMFFCFNLLYGDDIADLISHIKSADSSQKRELINKLKIRLRDVNTHERQKIVKQLRHQYHHKNINKQNALHKQNRQHKNEQNTHHSKKIKNHK